MDKVADIVKLALENEIRAKVFYAKASEITSVGESQMVFLELAGMEDQHAQLLVKRFGALLHEQGFDAADHLQRSEARTEHTLGIEETRLITDGEMRAVVEFAIGMEIRARDTYREMAGHFPAADTRSLCENLAAEEQKHHDMLSNLRVSMDTPIDERPAL